jgi:hypothetical protein
MTLGQIGVKSTASCWSYEASITMSPEFLGRWESTRTCNLRCWRTRRSVFSGRPAFLGSSARHVSADVRLGCLRQYTRTAVTTAVNGLKRNRSRPQKMRLKRGRWDRNRTCNLRFWSLLPFVQGRSRAYTKGLKIGHFDVPKCVEVHQRSPALGSKLGSKQSSIPVSLVLLRELGRGDLLLDFSLVVREAGER